ncbi:MAG: DUF2892 domain-containing protein [Pseudomonadota bacterium]|nr:DUF2892 domain-containing protein [Pseudomonadota bacterium]
MSANVGASDRLIRFALGIAVLSLLFVLSVPHKYWGLIGVVPILTAIINFCPLYRLLGISTSKQG